MTHTKKPAWIGASSAKVLLGATMVLSAATTSCGDPQPHGWAMSQITRDYVFPTRDQEGKIVKEGTTVDAATLNYGRRSYMAYCYACHGVNGDGKGPAAVGLRPPPRDFRTGDFKFGAVRSGELPSDEDLARIVKGGLHGTAMQPWDVPDDELWRIIQFIKTFPVAACDPKVEGEKTCAKIAKKYPDGKPNRWGETYSRGKKKGQPKPIGEPIPITKDPWKGKEAAARQKGAELYHLKAQCANCHPSYLTRQEMSAMSMKLNGKPMTSFRDGMYSSIVLAAKDNPYKVNLMPPNFALNPVRSIRTGHEQDDLYRLIASGVGGVMPAWIDGLKQDEIWALVHYIKSLVDLRKSENRDALRKMRAKLENQPAVAPPPAPAPPPPPAPEPEPEKDEEGDDADPAASASAAASAAPSAAPAAPSAAPAAPAPAAPAPKPAAPKPAAPKPAAPKPKPAAPKPAPAPAPAGGDDVY